MVTTKRALYSACLMFLGIGAASADTAPKTLHMRASKAPQKAAAKPVRVAQTPPPDSGGTPPDNGGTPPTPPPDNGTPPTPPPPENPPPANPPPANPPPPEQPNVGATPNLSDEEMAKLAEQEANKGEEVITVTGSLVGRKELTTAAPVSVVDREKLEAAGITNVGDILQKLPSQGNALNAQNNNGGDGSTRLDLRSLGTNRTLTLMNGRRVVSSGLGADDSVDIGTIPLAIIERVEVLKDGASAIYGSDAIAGVVNIITRQDFNGSEATVYAGTSGHGDGTNYDLSFVTGHSSKKGNVMFAVGYQQQDAVMAGDRDFSKQTYAYDFADAATGMCGKAGQDPCAILSGSSASATGRINTSDDGTGNPFTIPGCTSKYCTYDPMTNGFRNYKSPTATTLGDNYNFQPLNYLFTPSSRVNLFSTGHYDITKNVSAFYEASYNYRKSEQQLAEEPIFTGLYGTPISAQSMYNPLGVDIIDYNRRLTEFGPRIFKQDVNTARAVVGVQGKIDEDSPALKNWKWEINFDYGRTTATNQTRGDLILSHLTNALGPSFMDPVNGPTCGTPMAPIPGCVPLSLLKTNTVTQDMINYLLFTGVQTGFNEQRSTTAQAHGKLVDLPNHGDISMAVGADYRHEQGGFQPDPLTSTGDTTGNAQQPTEGSYSVFEGFGEVSIVPVSGLDFAQWVELDFAARAYDYNQSFGSGGTYKGSAIWKTAGGISLRGTYGTAFRAPSIGELFAGHADSFPLVEDPCDTMPPSAGTGTIVLDPNTQKECTKQMVPKNSTFGTGQQRSTVGGNKGLSPETAKILTAGIVYEPLKGLGITLDYWNIDITNAIQTLPVSTILSNCYEHDLDNFCNQIQRDPASHQISHIIDLAQNVGEVLTSGLDFSIAYGYKVPGAGQFRHALEGTYLFKYNLDTGQLGPDGKDQLLHGKGFFDLGVLPDLKVNLLTSWMHPSGFGAGFNIRYIDGFQECDNDDCNDPSNARRKVDAYFNADVFLDYVVKSSEGTTRIAAGINNVLDRQPSIIYNGAALNSDESAYDFMGRFFYVRLSQLF